MNVSCDHDKAVGVHTWKKLVKAGVDGKVLWRSEVLLEAIQRLMRGKEF